MSASPSRVLLLGTDVAGVITGVTTGTSDPVNASPFTTIVLYAASQGTTSGGTILFEEADWDPTLDAPYSGTWITLATLTASTFSGGAQTKVIPVLNSVGGQRSAWAFVRARINSNITGGGTITAVLRMA
jgi:hypothetical protein